MITKSSFIFVPQPPIFEIDFSEYFLDKKNDFKVLTNAVEDPFQRAFRVLVAILPQFIGAFINGIPLTGSAGKVKLKSGKEIKFEEPKKSFVDRIGFRFLLINT